jgi:hypothetical protein
MVVPTINDAVMAHLRMLVVIRADALQEDKKVESICTVLRLWRLAVYLTSEAIQRGRRSGVSASGLDSFVSNVKYILQCQRRKTVQASSNEPLPEYLYYWQRDAVLPQE